MLNGHVFESICKKKRIITVMIELNKNIEKRFEVVVLLWKLFIMVLLSVQLIIGHFVKHFSFDNEMLGFERITLSVNG